MKELSGIRDLLSAFNLKVVSSSLAWGIVFVHQDNKHRTSVLCVPDWVFWPTPWSWHMDSALFQHIWVHL